MRLRAIVLDAAGNLQTMIERVRKGTESITTELPRIARVHVTSLGNISDI